MLAGEHMTMPDHPGPAAPPPKRGLVAIGGSAGGIPALIAVLGGLPGDFPLPILVVQHLPREVPSSLPAVVGWRTRLRVKWAEHNERLLSGTVYIAPPDRHLLVVAGARLALSSAARVGYWRPAIDALFLSAAELYGDSVAAIVLSGAMWDGAKGIAAVAKGGGITIVQDEASSSCFDMPAAALDLGGADAFMNPPAIARALRVLAYPAA
jgi:two-component system chemotaxis response regulator CheB